MQEQYCIHSIDIFYWGRISLYAILNIPVWGFGLCVYEDSVTTIGMLCYFKDDISMQFFSVWETQEWAILVIVQIKFKTSIKGLLTYILGVF